jgi:hypothetical protein
MNPKGESMRQFVRRVKNNRSMKTEIKYQSLKLSEQKVLSALSLST